jgi:hypothetical protein
MSTIKEWLKIVPILALPSSGCALLAGAPAAKPGVMKHPPPAPKEERVGSVRAGEVWVRGYYEVFAGDWVWRSGHPQLKRPGYYVVDAQYVEDNGEYGVLPPHYSREKLANNK